MERTTGCPRRDRDGPDRPALTARTVLVCRENGTCSSRERYLLLVRTVLICCGGCARGVCGSGLLAWLPVGSGSSDTWGCRGPLVVCWPGFVCVSRSEPQGGRLPRLRWGPGRARRRKGLSGTTPWPRRDPGTSPLTCVDIERTKVQVGWARPWVPDCYRTRHPAPPGPCKPPVAGTWWPDADSAPHHKGTSPGRRGRSPLTRRPRPRR